MRSTDIGRPLALSIAAIALLNAVAALSRPDGRPLPPWVVAIGFGLLMAHAVIYYRGAVFRERFGLTRYVLLQAVVVLAAGLARLPMPVVACVYIALTTQVISLASERWGSAPITVGAVLLFALNCTIAYDLYQGAMAGLLLALTGAVAHALLGLRRADSASPRPAPASNGSNGLTPREIDVLKILATGARNSEVAGDLQITERTVKAHLKSIYQKLGVETRTGAVSAARRLGVLG